MYFTSIQIEAIVVSIVCIVFLVLFIVAYYVQQKKIKKSKMDD